MTTDNPMHIVLPLIDSLDTETAVPVAQTMAEIFSAPLHVMTAEAQVPHELAHRLSVSTGKQNAVAIETNSGNLVDALIRKANALPQAIVTLAFRLPAKTARNKVQAAQALRQQVLEKITCPILVVPPDRDMRTWRLKRELLPQDGTPGCAAALAQVLNQRSIPGIENLILRVAGAGVCQPSEPGSLATPCYVDHPHFEWEAWGQEFVDRIRAMGVDLSEGRLRLLMAAGEPAAEILRIAQEHAVDMIILPWHGTLGSGRASMVKAVLRGAICPVLLLPANGRHRCMRDDDLPR